MAGLQIINQSNAFAQQTSNKWEASLLVHRPIANREQTLKQAVALADIQNTERDQLVHQWIFLGPVSYSNAGNNCFLLIFQAK